MTLKDVKKYFLHGLIFSVLMFVIFFGWIFLLAFLILLGSIIGLIIGLAVLVYVIGWLNVKLLKYFWNFEAGSKWTELLFHGFILLMALLLVGIPQFLLVWQVPSPVTSVVLFVVYCFVDGYVARNLAEALY